MLAVVAMPWLLQEPQGTIPALLYPITSLLSTTPWVCKRPTGQCLSPEAQRCRSVPCVEKQQRNKKSSSYYES
jgi:hypothetical protein